MALNFPDSPTLNQTYAEAGKVWIFNGSRWAMLSPAAFTLADSAVTTAKIAAGAVTAEKINTAVTLDDIPDVTITTAVTYAIGDTGPGGGKIFITPSTAGNSTGKYFEVAPSSAQVARTWATNVNSNQTTVVSGADGTAIGTGAQNTIDIVAQAGNVAATSAAAYASDYTNGGFSDWFLPSKNELNELYTQIAVLSSPQNNYWSSTEYGGSTAWSQDFFGGGQYADEKVYGNGGPVTIHVRPVRSFTAATNPGAVSGQALTWNGTAWVNSTLAAAPKVYVTEYTTNGAGTWTCPAGVTQIKLTLIGAGGLAGNAEAITPNSSTSQSFSNTATESTTFVVGGTTYTALGGKKGESVSVSGPIFVMSGTGYTQNSSGSSASSGIGTDFSRYPGCGGAPAVASAETYISMTNGTLTFEHTSRAKALGYRGQDGVIEVFQVTVVPATTYSFSIGAGAGYTGPNESYAGSNGAVIIEYVV